MKVSNSKNIETPNSSAAAKMPASSATNGLTGEMALNKPNSATDSAAPKNFAGILEEVRTNSTERREDKRDDNARETQKSKRTAKDTETEATDNAEKRIAENREEKNKNSDSNNGEQQNPNAFAQAGQFLTLNGRAEFDAPNARSILHVADLERIVAAVRAQIENGKAEIAVKLRNSVLDGLQIKITSENGKLTAEFIASSAEVKKQIDARAGELAEIMRSRGLNLVRLSTALGAETSGQKQEQKAFSGQLPQSKTPAAKDEAADSVAEIENFGAETTYRV